MEYRRVEKADASENGRLSNEICERTGVQHFDLDVEPSAYQKFYDLEN